MRKILLGVTAIVLLAWPAEAQLYVWGGRNYCWYANGWRGPGWYWCGYRLRRGYGWGGAYGWHGWGDGRRGLVREHRGNGYRGGAHAGGHAGAHDGGRGGGRAGGHGGGHGGGGHR